MRGRKYSSIGFLLFMTVIFTGMCFEDVRTDSSFAYVKTGKIPSQMVAVGTVIDNEQVCTTRMLQLQGRTVIRRLTDSFVQQKNEAKTTFEMLCPNIYAKEQGKDSPGDWIFLADSVNSDEWIALFEHKADGKKRIG